MQLINEVIEKIKELEWSGSAFTLSEALASACNSSYGVSALTVSVGLDAENKALVLKLFNIRSEPDYNNADQDAALRWLKKEGLINDKVSS